jgi:hypothetical protein
MMVDDPSTQKNVARKGPVSTGDEISADKDLSTEIERVIEREPLDQVRCVRVFGNYYRCNWWSRLGGPRTGLDYDWAGLLMDFIRKSRFLIASMQTGELVIKEVESIAAGQQNSGNKIHVGK